MASRTIPPTIPEDRLKRETEPNFSPRRTPTIVTSPATNPIIMAGIQMFKFIIDSPKPIARASILVAMVIAPYLGVAGEVILFAALVVAGMPFLLLVGAAPNAIAYDSGQFTTGEFFLYGIPASIILMIVTGFAVFVLWPLIGMPVLING